MITTTTMMMNVSMTVVLVVTFWWYDGYSAAAVDDDGGKGGYAYDKVATVKMMMNVQESDLYVGDSVDTNDGSAVRSAC
jgi:hypothetical protein